MRVVLFMFGQKRGGIGGLYVKGIRYEIIGMGGVIHVRAKKQAILGGGGSRSKGASWGGDGIGLIRAWYGQEKWGVDGLAGWDRVVRRQCGEVWSWKR